MFTVSILLATGVFGALGARVVKVGIRLPPQVHTKVECKRIIISFD